MDPAVHLLDIPQCIVQNGNVYTSVLGGMLDGCIVGWVSFAYCYYCLTDLTKSLCGTYDIDIFTMIWYLYVYVSILYLRHLTIVPVQYYDMYLLINAINSARKC